MPAGMAADNTGLFFLFIKGNTNITGWQIVESAIDLEDVSKTSHPAWNKVTYP